MNRQVQFGRPAPMISKKHAQPEKKPWEMDITFPSLT